MISQDELAAITEAPPEGRKQRVVVRVDFLGGNKQDPGRYHVSFQGNGATPEGILVCLGPPGHTIASNRYVFTFIANPGNYLKDASFANPGPPPEFDFVVGVIENPDDPCCITPDASEFSAPVLGPRGIIVFVDLKDNSNHALGYRFTVWVTHHDGTVFPVPCDPRIINK